MFRLEPTASGCRACSRRNHVSKAWSAPSLWPLFCNLRLLLPVSQSERWSLPGHLGQNHSKRLDSMKKNIIWTRILCIAGLAAGLSAVAAPLQRADVTAEPAWLVHVDCDALRPTAIGQYLLSELDKPEAKGQLGAFQAIFSFDPRQQLHG